MNASLDTARHQLPQPITRSEMLVGSGLLLILIITRSGHFGSSIKLPDASWAMFVLCGMLTTRLWWPMLFMIVAAMVDYIVIDNGVSSYCITPAYLFLIPAYLALWGAGRWSSKSLNVDLRSTLRIVLALFNGVSIAFIISNLSFYFFSGYFAKLSLWDYAQAVMKYWPMNLWHTTIYTIAGLLIHFITQQLRHVHAPQHQ